VFASESTSFDLIEAEFMREVEPGEMVVVDAKGLRSVRPFTEEGRRFCVFEHVYFARPDSIIDGRSVHRVREALGQQLAKEHPVEADVVIAVPDSGTAAAIGYSHATAFATTRDSSALTTSGAPSSSRSSPSATSVCGSSSTPSARC